MGSEDSEHLLDTEIQLFTGKKTETLHGLCSAIYKIPCQEAVYLSETGFQGDEQADQRHHGGSDRALHYYPAEHYAYWQACYPEVPHFHPSGFGENLSGIGLTEENCHVGDIFRLGEARVQISQPRSPCYKLNLRFDVVDLACQMQKSGRTGWLLRVLQPGWVKPGDKLILESHGSTPLSLYHMNHIFFNEPLNHVGLVAMADCAELSASWKDKVVQRLQTGWVEDWNRRLFGHALWAREPHSPL